MTIDNASAEQSTVSSGGSESPDGGRPFWPTFGIVAAAAVAGGLAGIVAVYAERLRAAGIHGFAELAAQTPERIREIIGRGAPLATGQIAAWIRESSELANGPGASGAESSEFG